MPVYAPFLMTSAYFRWAERVSSGNRANRIINRNLRETIGAPLMINVILFYDPAKEFPICKGGRCSAQRRCACPAVPAKHGVLAAAKVFQRAGVRVGRRFRAGGGVTNRIRHAGPEIP